MSKPIFITSDYDVKEEDEALSAPAPLTLYPDLMASAQDWLDYAKEKNLNADVRAFLGANPQAIRLDGQESGAHNATPRNWHNTCVWMDALGVMEEKQLLASAFLGKTLSDSLFDFIKARENA